ncbi:ESPR domain-containing protein [Megasphaera sp.]|uniref:ESPR domain-containing protein n=1 Tax=Megasphaera sp. TaxID=2023260 RepID=UPI003425B992
MHIMQRKGLFFMNRTYKVIWSKARRCYVVVSELAKSQHKSSSNSEQISSNVHRGGGFR